MTKVIALTGFETTRNAGDRSGEYGLANGAGPVKLRLRVWNGVVVCYLAIIIFLLTLNPFQFQAFVPSEFWVWRFGLKDFLQNILLLFPLGAVLKHTFRRSLLAIMLCGFLLSLSAEVCQLFVEIRTSNVVDLVSNASGALLGGLFYQKVLHQPVSSEPVFSDPMFVEPASSEVRAIRAPLFTFGIPFSFMLLPFCWVEAMRAVSDPAYVWLLLPGAIAGLSVLSGALAATSATAWQRLIAIGVWAIAAIAPIFPVNPQLGVTFLITAPMIAQVLSTARRAFFRASIVAILGVGLGVTLKINGVWYFTANAWTWGIPVHLRWIEVGMSAIAFLSSSLWASGVCGRTLHSRRCYASEVSGGRGLR